MQPFHMIIIAVAIIVLIATTLLMYISYNSKNPLYPPVSVDCPDYWKLDANGLCEIPQDGTNMGNIKGHQLYEYVMIDRKKKYSPLPKLYNKFTKKEEQGTPYYDTLGYYTTDFPHGYNEKTPQINKVNFKHINWNIYGSGLCEKQKWANVHNIAWDGISNYNHCKPPE